MIYIDKNESLVMLLDEKIMMVIISVMLYNLYFDVVYE